MDTQTTTTASSTRSPALIAAGVIGLCAVAIGAAGDHMLDGALDAHMTEVFETALRYHQIYSIVLLVTALPGVRAVLDPAFAVFLCGVLVFCGSLYAMVLSGVTALGMVTPLGGMLLMAGWAVVIWRGVKPRG